jgi:hypothetical protein
MPDPEDPSPDSPAADDPADTEPDAGEPGTGAPGADAGDADAADTVPGADDPSAEADEAAAAAPVDAPADVAPKAARLPGGPAATMFLGIGLFVGIVTAIYWFTSYEDAGSVMLLFTAGMALWFGVFLTLWQRRADAVTVEAAASQAPVVTAAYQPHASVWPFVMGLGAATLINGLVLGIWVVVPGAAILILGLGGFIRQTRRRD